MRLVYRVVDGEDAEVELGGIRGLQAPVGVAKITAASAAARYLPVVKLAPQEIRTYFVTALTAHRRRLFRVDANARLMMDVLAHYVRQERFAMHAYVIMPDHVHFLLTPAPTVSLEKAMQFIKGGFSYRLKSRTEVWERGYNEVQILTLVKFCACREYIELNPVKAGLAKNPGDYAFCSVHKQSWLAPMPGHFVASSAAKAASV